MDTDNTTPPFGLEPLLDVIELAAYLGVPVSTVYDWRTNGKGPRAFRFGKRLKFAVSDVQVWIGQHRDPDPSGPGNRGGYVPTVPLNSDSYDAHYQAGAYLPRTSPTSAHRRRRTVRLAISGHRSQSLRDRAGTSGHQLALVVD